jgi:glutamine synthetase
MTTDSIGALTADLAAAGVLGVTIVWADNNGIPRSRTVPIVELDAVARRGVGATALLAVFDTHDTITYGYEGLRTPSGDTRLVPVLDRLVRLAGQPALAWAPGRVLTSEGEPWPFDPRGALEAQLARAATAGLEVRAGYELEFFVGLDEEEPHPAHAGPAYSPHALLAVDELTSQLLGDLAANGLAIGQLHAEYGLAQVEISLPVADPLRAADDQLLARQTIRAAARAHGLRVSFAPLITPQGVGQGWHLHTSVVRGDRNLLAGGPTGDGASYVAGLLRDLAAIVAVTAPSVPSLARLRPGYFAGAYTFWGIQNREATLRYVPDTPFLGAAHANVELKACDASANPYLALAAVIAAGLSGIEDGLTLPEPIQEDPGAWSEQERERRGVVRLPGTAAEQEQALLGSERVCAALGEERLQAFLAVRRSDAAWAAERTLEEIVAAHLWRY